MVGAASGPQVTPGPDWLARPVSPVGLVLLSVLMMHFARDSNGNCKQLYSLCEERFVHTRGLQKAISLSEAGPHVYWKEGVWFPKI